jgi:hypothetical protein
MHSGLHVEPPQPSRTYSRAFRFRESKAQNAGECLGQNTNHVEAGISFLQLISCVPAAQLSLVSLLQVGNVFRHTRYAQPGKQPASNTPSKSLNGIKCDQTFTKPIPRRVIPHKRHTVGRNARAPAFLSIILAIGMDRAYVGMKTTVMMLYRSPIRLRSVRIPDRTAMPRFVRSIRQMQNKRPHVSTSLLSTWRRIRFCSCFVKPWSTSSGTCSIFEGVTSSTS